MRFLLFGFLLITAPLAQAFYSISGTVTDTAGNLLEEAWVYVYRADGSFRRSTPVHDGSFSLSSPDSHFYLVILGREHRAEVYPNKLCDYIRVDNSGTPAPGCSFTGAKLFPPDSTSNEKLEVVLDRLPVVSGRVKNSRTGETVAEASVCYFYDLQYHHLNCTVSGADGYYSKTIYPGLKTFVAGLKYAYYPTTSDGARCPPPSSIRWYEGCLSVMQDDHGFMAKGDYLLDVPLDPMAMIRGRVMNAVTDSPFESVKVFALDEAMSSSMEERYTSASGEFLLAVPRGRYKIRADRGNYNDYFFASLHDNLVCESSCPTTGTTLVLEEGDVADVGDIHLWPQRGVYGFVTSSVRGRNLEGVLIDVWDESGEHLDSVVTGANGGYHSISPCQPYYACRVLISTANADGFTDEVYDDISCPDGPAFHDLCDVTPGTSTAIGADTLGENRADFRLDGDALFVSGFE